MSCHVALLVPALGVISSSPAFRIPHSHAQLDPRPVGRAADAPMEFPIPTWCNGAEEVPFSNLLPEAARDRNEKPASSTPSPTQSDSRSELEFGSAK